MPAPSSPVRIPHIVDLAAHPRNGETSEDGMKMSGRAEVPVWVVTNHETVIIRSFTDGTEFA
jgi:hypothetical protein